MSIEQRTNNETGLTLVELIIFIVVVSVGLVGILSVFNIAARGSADPMIHKQMLAIAEGLMEEVEVQPFTYCDPDDASATTASLSGGAIVGCTTLEQMGPEGETRSGTTPFDNVNDYASLATLNPVKDIADNSNPNLAGYTATIAVAAESLSGINSNSTPATMNALRITVTVNNTNSNESLVLEGYRTRHSPNSVP